MRRILLAPIVALFFTPAALAQTRDLILPIALNGYTTPPVHYQTIIRIVNMSASTVDVTLEAYQNDGSAVRILELFPITRPGTKTVLSIPGGGSVETFTAEDTPSLNGWIRLTFDSAATILATAEVALINAPVGPHPICMRPSTEIVTSVQVSATAAASRFSGFAINRTTRKSAYALVNPSTSEKATAFLSLMDGDGKFVASGTIEIPPQGRLARFLHEFLPSAPSDFMGSFRVTSTIPIGFGGVNVLFPEGEFVGIQAASPPPEVCIQVITPARNPLTGECRVFPTPCDVPDGWVRVASCTAQ
jgi:hypothetical protein